MGLCYCKHTDDETTCRHFLSGQKCYNSLLWNGYRDAVFSLMWNNMYGFRRWLHPSILLQCRKYSVRINISIVLLLDESLL
jgi:hypothetical protein